MGARVLVVVAYHNHDIERALDLLRWMLELNGGQEKRHRLLTVADFDVSLENEDRVKAAGYAAFGTQFNTRLVNPERRGWPCGPNAMFTCASAFNRMHIKETWFWCEPDCIPLKRGWIDALQAEYDREKKPYLGFIHGKPWRHMTGCGVYPWEIYKYNPQSLMANTQPWDVIDPQQTIAHCHETKLIHHVWSFQGDQKNSAAPTFPSRASMGVISPDAVLFHRCKDGTLIERLRGKPTNTPIYLPGDTCIVQLGRYGDLLNILPVVKYIHDHYGKPSVMVAKQFADLFDGVNYAHKCVFDGGFGDVEAAVELAQKKFALVIVSQVWGHTWRVPHECESYNMESWRMAGFLDRWTDPAMKLELSVPIPLAMPSRPSIAVCLSSGHSSPFKEWASVQAHIQDGYSGAFDVVDLATMVCDRVYDLLKWIRSARVLITSDTATLHLAAACKTPVVALVNDAAWLATTPRCNCVLRLHYGEALSRIGEIDKVIEKYSGMAGGIRKMIGAL